LIFSIKGNKKPKIKPEKISLIKSLELICWLKERRVEWIINWNKIFIENKEKNSIHFYKNQKNKFFYFDKIIN